MNDTTLSPPTSATGPAHAAPSHVVAAPPEPDPSDIRAEIPGTEAPPVDNAHVAAGCEQFADAPPASNIVEASAACLQADPLLAGMPEPAAKPPLVFTPEALAAAGVVFQSTDVTKSVEINSAAQAAVIALASGYSSHEIVAAVLAAYGIEGQVQMNTHPATATLSIWQSTKSPKDDAVVNGEPSNSVSGTDAVIAERGKVYGDPELSHENIGLNWTGMLQQHYQLRFDHPLPAWLVELMMAGFKIHRSARVFHEDNYVDLEAYGLKFAREHQRAAFAGKAGA